MFIISMGIAIVESNSVDYQWLQSWYSASHSNVYACVRAMFLLINKSDTQIYFLQSWIK